MRTGATNSRLFRVTKYLHDSLVGKRIGDSFFQAMIWLPYDARMISDPSISITLQRRFCSLAESNVFLENPTNGTCRSEDRTGSNSVEMKGENGTGTIQAEATAVLRKRQRRNLVELNATPTLRRKNVPAADKLWKPFSPARNERR
jgi:hypothetical protein